MGFTLVDGVYEPIAPSADGSLHSAVLGLDFHLHFDDLRLYDPERGEWVLTPEAAADARAAQAAARAAAAEAEAAELRAELARLRGNL